MEPRNDEPIITRENDLDHNDVLGITNDILPPSNSKLYGKELITKTSMKRKYFANPMALRYNEVDLTETGNRT